MLALRAPVLLPETSGSETSAQTLSHAPSQRFGLAHLWSPEAPFAPTSLSPSAFAVSLEPLVVLSEDGSAPPSCSLTGFVAEAEPFTAFSEDGDLPPLFFESFVAG